MTDILSRPTWMKNFVKKNMDCGWGLVAYICELNLFEDKSLFEGAILKYRKLLAPLFKANRLIDNKN